MNDTLLSEPLVLKVWEYWNRELSPSYFDFDKAMVHFTKWIAEYNITVEYNGKQDKLKMRAATPEDLTKFILIFS